MIATPIYTTLLAEGLLYQQYAPNIHAFSFASTSNELIDIAYERVRQLDLESSQQQKHVGYMFVFDDVAYTPYMLQKAIQSTKTNPEQLNESVAVVSDSFLTSVIQRVIMPNLDASISASTHFFTTELEALDWLKERAKSFNG